MSKKEQIVCGLDIGTTKICMVLARSRGDEDLEILSSGYAESSGLRKGVVVDLDRAAESIRRAADEAELKSGLSADWATVGFSGDHVQSFNCHGAASIEAKNREVRAEDMRQVVSAAQSIPLPPDRTILHVLPQEFFLDGRGGILNPVGLTGSRLDVDVHVVTCDSSLMQNQISAVNRAQMRVRKIVLQQLASAEAVLTDDERELGAAVVDIGGGTTDVALYFRNAIRFTGVIPVGGMHFTRDVAVGLRTPIEEAERLKKESGSALAERVADDEMLNVPGVATRSARDIPRKTMCHILGDRAVELLELVRDQIARAGGPDQLVAGVVITGGGSLLEGLIEMAEDVLQMPVRAGLPQALSGLTEELAHPVYATAIGLAMLETRKTGHPSTLPGKSGPSPWLTSRFLSWVGG